ncbi:MAG: VanZ family protein [Ignavibacteria bacterium]|nr:VanZ family protein [Ignavibacteria bacterium]
MSSTKFLLIFPSVFVAIVIFIISHIPSGLIIPKAFELQDKIFHFIIYFIFGTTLIVAFTRYEKKSKAIFWIILIGFLYALSDEIHQKFVPGRSFEFLDLIADYIGIATSLLFREKIWKYLQIKYIINE